MLTGLKFKICGIVLQLERALCSEDRLHELGDS